MADELRTGEKLIWGLPADTWEAAFKAPPTLWADRYALTGEGAVFRLAFGENGAPLSDTERDVGRYSVAVAIPIDVAAQLRDSLNRVLEPIEAAAAARAEAAKP